LDVSSERQAQAGDPVKAARRNPGNCHRAGPSAAPATGGRLHY
jgi:hypothetical protein